MRVITKQPKKSTLDKLYEKALSIKTLRLHDDLSDIEKTIAFLNANKGKKRAYVIDELDVSPSSLNKAARAVGYKFLGERPSIKARLLELDTKKYTSKELAEMLGCAVVSINNAARELGLQIKRV